MSTSIASLVAGVDMALLQEDMEEDLACVRRFDVGVLGGCELEDASGRLAGRVVEGFGASFLLPPKKDIKLFCLRDSVDAFAFGAMVLKNN